MKKLTLVLGLAVCTSFAFAQNNFDQVIQTGDDNASTVTQFHSGPGTGLSTNNAYVNQLGDDNTSTVLQETYRWGTPNPITGEFADVDQLGNDNIAVITQTGYSSANVGVIMSVGDDNEAYITQNGSYNTSYIYQLGDDNYGKAIVNGTHNESVPGFGFGTEIYQVGEGNSADQTIAATGRSWYNNLYVNQLGDGNDADQSIEGLADNTGDYNKGLIYQTGDDNTGLQEMKVLGVVQRNFIRLEQVGDDNISHQIISGSDNDSFTYQRNDLNQSYTTVTGNFNTSYTYQNW